MKRKSIVIISVVIVLIISFLVGTGFRERTDIVLADYSVSEDGTKLIFKTATVTETGMPK